MEKNIDLNQMIDDTQYVPYEEITQAYCKLSLYKAGYDNRRVCFLVPKMEEYWRYIVKKKAKDFAIDDAIIFLYNDWIDMGKKAKKYKEDCYNVFCVLPQMGGGGRALWRYADVLWSFILTTRQSIFLA